MTGAVLMQSTIAPDSPVASEASALHIDPLLVAQAEEVWHYIATPENSMWPGWDATETPILFYLPGIQELLINHPDPPEGFVRYDGPVRFSRASMSVRHGATHFDADGQNTSTDIDGVRTLVVADTLSNRKMNIGGLLFDPRPAPEKIETLGYDSLRADPYVQMQMIAHEAFHVYQDLHSEGKHADESTVALYPTLSVDNNVGFAMEGESLVRALQAVSAADVREAALDWLAIRRHRRSLLSPEAIAYEDGNEFAEGLAKYIEWRLLNVLQGRSPDSRLYFAQGFRGYDDLQPQREALLKQVGMNLRGEVNVNNDPYGAAPLRFRLYFSGMAVAALLDRIAAADEMHDWKRRIFDPDTTLTSLAADVLNADPVELERRMRRIAATEIHAEFVGIKTSLFEEGQAHIQSMVESIERGDGTRLTLDYSSLPGVEPRLGFTPFGVQRIDADRAIYHMVPISGRLRDQTVFHQTVPRPVLHDRAAKRLTFRLPETVTEDALLAALDRSALSAEPLTVDGLALPGASMELGRVRIELDGDALVLFLLD
jgi:hypothetical protein